MTRAGRVDRGALDLDRDQIRRRARRLLASPYATASAKKDAQAVLAGHAMTEAIDLLRRELGARVVVE